MSTISTVDILDLILRKLDQFSSLPQHVAEVHEEVRSLRSELKESLQDLARTRKALAEKTAQLKSAEAEIATLRQEQTKRGDGPV